MFTDTEEPAKKRGRKAICTYVLRSFFGYLKGAPINAIWTQVLGITCTYINKSLSSFESTIYVILQRFERLEELAKHIYITI
jgi:hypothetical protein